MGGVEGGGNGYYRPDRCVCVCNSDGYDSEKNGRISPLYTGIAMDLHQSGAKCGGESQKSQIKGTISPGWMRPESGLGGQILNSIRIIVLHGPRCIALVFSKPSKCKCTLKPS